ncbi:MAG: hypothetical protein DRN08_06470 [Thermoplasmata archaeon]|nr:MAG: hypothetical protein DRN08_06470 [Thermoplasmata archaeon]
MTIEKQKIIWEKEWKERAKFFPQKILESRFTKEAYNCLESFIDGREDKLILELGCGTGRFCCLLGKDFPHTHIIGLDISSSALQIASFLKESLHIDNVEFILGDLFNSPFVDNSFDVVFSEGVIEHFSLEETPNYIQALREMIRLVKRGGKVILGVPNWYSFPHTFYKWILREVKKEYKYGYEKSFRYSEIKEMFSKFGLRNIEVLGFYPAHSFYRLAGSGFFRIFYYLGKTTDKILNISPLFLKRILIKRYGFEIIVKGIKL